MDRNFYMDISDDEYMDVDGPENRLSVVQPMEIDGELPGHGQYLPPVPMNPLYNPSDIEITRWYGHNALQIGNGSTALQNPKTPEKPQSAEFEKAKRKIKAIRRKCRM
ncbi:Hypothetical protein NTJ_14153 [Nesidiocoris tenuis]|uniref:Uncharacterized protein n=1 Tax=Nesidiocoris tenuis TaxID=355587 RepID=A0ABN7BAC3_9HEMI|nr:Hypothetical protein NTJ_14153 [Nesidiocoris tenuis]